MRGALIKKRYGIPAALLLVLLLSGTALAWYCFATVSSKTTVQEPLSNNNDTGFKATMYAGKTNTWTFDIVNSADLSYTVKADLTYSAPNGVTIANYSVTGDASSVTLQDADGSGGLSNGDSITFNIFAGGTATCTINISAARDATPGDVTASFALYRK